MRNLKLSMKFGSGIGLVLIALIIVGGTGFTKITDVQSIVADLSDTHLPLFKIVADVNVSVAKQAQTVTQLTMNKDSGNYMKISDLNRSVSQKFEEVRTLIKSDQELLNMGWLKQIEKISVQYDAFANSCNALIDAIRNNKTEDVWTALVKDVSRKSDTFLEHSNGFLDMNNKESHRVAGLAEKSAHSGRWILGLLSLFSVVIGIALTYFLSLSIIKPIHRIVDGLHTGTDQVASASGQVSSASQSLAEGASEQAASIEETSSSLEEMASMTRQNADNASQADNLMKEANQIVNKANMSMNQMTKSMAEISNASEETSKIIKTIDEIAFQTNLLALNAAVEAARAGEAGSGFAVVADEVRNLALRAADAAKNTADLIEGTVKKIKDGSDLVSATNEAFDEVESSAGKVGELVGEIAAASKEQALGIEQVNQAVVEMDKVVQQNAANAEESASASEEMNAQAEQMRLMVDELAALIVGRTVDDGKEAWDSESSFDKTQSETVMTVPPEFSEKTQSKAPVINKEREMTPKQIIPLDDSDFQDF